MLEIWWGGRYGKDEGLSRIPINPTMCRGEEEEEEEDAEKGGREGGKEDERRRKQEMTRG